VAVPISAERKALGTLHVGTAEGPLTALDTTVAGHAATAAALIMLMERARAEGEARGQSELLVAVLNDRGGSSRELERRATALGFDPHAPFAVLHVSFGPLDGRSDGDLSEVARWAIQRGLSARRTNALQAWDGADVTLLVPVTEERVPSFVRGLLADVATFAGRQQPDAAVTCGIGRVSSSLADVRGRFHEAVTACRLGLAINGPGSITEYGSLGPYPALYAALHEERSAVALDELQDRYLGAAARYEAEAGLPLLETLSAYFAERGNVSATARTLRINRQSLLYRLERFTALSGIDLGSPVDRFALELAVRCWRMRSGQVDGRPASGNGAS
jgi:sugar diacid utilization regulator